MLNCCQILLLKEIVGYCCALFSYYVHYANSCCLIELSGDFFAVLFFQFAINGYFCGQKLKDLKL